MPRSYPEPAVPRDFACWVLRTSTQLTVVDRRTGARATRPADRWDVRGKADGVAGAQTGTPAAYDPWGSPYTTGHPASNIAGGAQLDAYGANGKLTEQAGTTALTLMGARGFTTSEARFLSPDPVTGGCANTYTYSFGDPLNGADLSGQQFYANATFQGSGGVFSVRAAGGGVFNWQLEPNPYLIGEVGGVAGAFSATISVTNGAGARRTIGRPTKGKDGIIGFFFDTDFSTPADFYSHGRATP